jgi:hypothetical protein
MPRKLRHGKRKHSFQDKKKRGRRGTSGVVVQRQADTQTEKLIIPATVVAPSASVLAPRPVVAAVRYPYVLIELRRIGILAGIVLAILVMLVFVLS